MLHQNFGKLFQQILKNCLTLPFISNINYAPIFTKRAEFQKILGFGLENSFWHVLSSGIAFAAIFTKRAEFQKNFRFALENSFWHVLSSGSPFSAIFSQRAQLQKKFQIRPGKFILACSQLRKRICKDFLKRAEFKKNISDSAWKIHFGMFSARETHLHRFSPTDPNF